MEDIPEYKYAENKVESTPTEAKLREQVQEDANEYRLAFERPYNVALEKLRPIIEGRRVKLIIGDDASGRIPTLALSKTINALYDADRTQHPQVRFVAGTTGTSGIPKGGRATGDEKIVRNEELAKHIENWTGVLGRGDHVIVMTELLGSGQGVSQLTDTLKEAAGRRGFSFTVVTLLVSEGWGGSPTSSMLREHYGYDVVYGRTKTERLRDDLYGQWGIQGVQKSNTRKVFADRYRGMDFNPFRHYEDVWKYPEHRHVLLEVSRSMVSDVAARAVRHYRDVSETNDSSAQPQK